MSAAIVQAVYDRLSTDTGSGGFCNATTGVGTRLFHLEGTEDVALPASVFMVSGPSACMRDFSNATTEEWQMTFHIWVPKETSTDSAAMTLDQALFARLNGQSLTASGYDRALVTCLTRGACEIDEDGIRADSEWLVRGTRA